MCSPHELCEPGETAEFDTQFFRRQLEDKLRSAAAAADAGYPDNEGLVIALETGIPSLKPHRAEGLTPSAKRLEQEIKARLPERTLTEIRRRCPRTAARLHVPLLPVGRRAGR
ncbi:hypothetical protein ACWGRV_35160 [Streptomyces sp. NPDC055663]